MKSILSKSILVSLLIVATISTSALAYENAMGFSTQRFAYTIPKKLDTLCQRYIAKLPKDKQKEAKENGCMTVDLELAKFNQPQYQWIANDLNQKLNTNPKLTKKMFDDIANEAYKELKERKAYWNVFESMREVKWISITPRLAQFMIEDYEYTGGAHGIPSSSAFVYDLKQKKRLHIDDILRSNQDKKKLEALLYQAYQNLFDNPQEFAEHEKIWKFYLSDNFYFTPNGMTFFYNPYGLGPYAMGFVNLTLKTADIKSLIKADYLADEFTHFDYDY